MSEHDECVKSIHGQTILERLGTATDVNAIDEEAKQYMETHPEDKGFRGRYNYWKRFWRNKISSAGAGTGAGVQGAKQQAKQSFALNNAVCTNNPIGGTTYPWTNISPVVMNDHCSGMVNAVCAAPSQPNTIYAGSRTGGIMKTTDGGATWASVTDQTNLPALGIGQIVVHPTNPDIVYAVTSMDDQGGTIVPTLSYGIGLLKSIDGGQNWTAPISWSPVWGRELSKLVMHPQNPDIMWLIGDKTAPDTPNDPQTAHVTIFKTTDAWATSENISDNFPDPDMNFFQGFTDIAVLPSSPLMTIAVVW